MNLDHMFVNIMVSSRNLPDRIAVERTNNKGKTLCAYVTTVHSNDSDTDVYNRIADAAIRPFAPGFIFVSEHAKLDQNLIIDTDDAILSVCRGKKWLDIGDLAWPLYLSDLISNRDLDTLAHYFGLSPNDSCTAEGRCKVTALVYWEMMRKYRAALVGETVIADLGGAPLAAARKFFGI